MVKHNKKLKLKKKFIPEKLYSSHGFTIVSFSLNGNSFGQHGLELINDNLFARYVNILNT